MKQFKVLIPTYLMNFKCIGPACSDLCCEGTWNVYVDHKTYKKYKNIRDNNFQRNFKSNISRVRALSCNQRYAKLNFTNNKCSFLQDNKLCKIHSDLGEDYLCNVCHQYPHMNNLVNNKVEQHATLSCPVITKLALMNKDGIDFTYIEKTKNEITPLLSGQIKYNLNEYNKYFEDIRSFCISIIQNRHYTIDERLFILGNYTDKLTNYINDKKYDQILDLIGYYKGLMLDPTIFKDIYGKLPSNISMQTHLVKYLMDLRLKQFQSCTDSAYFKFFADFLVGLDFKEGNNLKDVELKYQESYTKYYKPFFNENEYILENLLVNTMYSNLFPLSQEFSPFDEFVTLVNMYTIIRLLILGVSSYKDSITVELVLDIIQSFSKEVEHNSRYMDFIKVFMKDRNFDTLAYMSILIKS